MEARKVSVSSQTFKANSAVLNKRQKARLREQKIIAYINSKPAGTCITLEDFMHITEHKSAGSVATMIQRMLKRKLLDRYLQEPKRFAYTVLDSTTTRVTAVQNRFGLKELESKAKEYVWENLQTEENNSLKGFMSWLKSQT